MSEEDAAARHVREMRAASRARVGGPWGREADRAGSYRRPGEQETPGVKPHEPEVEGPNILASS